MAAYWRGADGWIAEFMHDVPKFVVSSSLEQADWHHSEIIRDFPGGVEKLKQQPGKPVFVAGSAELTAALMRHGLVDEFRIMINPILLGSGTSMFRAGFARLPLDLVDVRQFESGLLVLRYRAAGKG